MSAPRFSQLATRDLNQILDYIAHHNPTAAESFVGLLKDKCQSLARFPLLGASRDQFVTGLRVFPVGNYVIYYRPEGDTVRIERVLHGARDADALLGDS